VTSAAAYESRESESLARRRAAASACRIASSICAYAATELGDGVPPGRAAAAARAAAAELEATARLLARLAGRAPGPRAG
jgi:hypothetical protein